MYFKAGMNPEREGTMAMTQVFTLEAIQKQANVASEI